MTRGTCPTDHKHAESSSCYHLHRCGCAPCREAARLREQHRRKQIAYGRYDTGLVDLTPVREHIEKLRAYGIGWKRVAELAGLGHTVVETIIYGHKTRGGLNKRVKRETAEKILAVKAIPENLRPGALVPAIGAQRRVQALVCNGWSLSQVAKRIGMEPTNFQLIMKRGEVQRKTHDLIRDLYEQLWATEPPVVKPSDRQNIARMRNLARAKGWLPPLAWDDPDTDPEPWTGDDDEPVFDHAAVGLVISGESAPGHRWTDAELEAVIRVLNVEQRMSDKDIGCRCGIDPQRINKARTRLGIPSIPADELRALRGQLAA